MSVCIAYGHRNHPLARIIKEIFGMWFQVLPEIPGLRRWQRRVRRFLLSQRKKIVHRCVVGRAATLEDFALARREVGLPNKPFVVLNIITHIHLQPKAEQQ